MDDEIQALLSEAYRSTEELNFKNNTEAINELFHRTGKLKVELQYAMDQLLAAREINKVTFRMIDVIGEYSSDAGLDIQATLDNLADDFLCRVKDQESPLMPRIKIISRLIRTSYSEAKQVDGDHPFRVIPGGLAEDN